MRVGHWYYVGDGRPLDDGLLRLLKQIGVDDVVLGDLPPSPGTNTPHALDLVELVRRCDDFGLRVISVENISTQRRFLEPIILGRPERDERIEQIAAVIRTIGRAGIPYYGYSWMVPPKPEGGYPVIRTSTATPGRAGALVSSFDLDLLRNLPLFRERKFSAEELWENHAYFLRAVLPVAEEAGVTLGLHPDDPPLNGSLGGIARLFGDVEAFERADQHAGALPWGLTFCLGNWQLLAQGELERALREFGTRGRLNYLHVQAVQGTAERFRECFFDEGECDFFRVVKTLKDIGFEGTLVPTHFPVLDGDTKWQGRSLAYGVGYVRALLRHA